MADRLGTEPQTFRTSKKDTTPGRILLVDDEAATRFARGRVLRAAGHTVFEAARIDEARVLIREMRPEVVVLDVHLPDGNGMEFAQQIKEDETLNGLMVLQMSASFVSDDDLVRGLDAGADAYLTEPTAPGVLLATTRALLRLSRAERALRETILLEQSVRQEAEAANRIKDDFLATLSHELRTPLHAIVGWTALMRNRPMDETARQHAIEVIERNAKAQAALIEDLLDVSRIALGQLRLTWDTIDLAPAIGSAVDSIKPTAEAKGVTLTLEDGLDAAFGVRGDATRLQQVLWNLLSNAVKFTPSTGRVTIRTSSTETRAEITIADTGRGISKEFLPRVFERFRHGERTSTTGERGLGLGLAIARELAELHGGTLSAASAGLNEGATFTLILPGRIDRSGRSSSST